MLDTLEINDRQRAYLFEMDSHQVGHEYPDREYIVVVDAGETIYYDALLLNHSPGYNEVQLRSFRTIDVPNAKRRYLWSEFYKTAPDRESDTTYVGWVSYVHTFTSGDNPEFQSIDTFIPVGSGRSQEASRDTLTTSSIPIRTWDVIDGKKTEVSQIDIRFTGPDTIEVTPRTDSLTPGHKAWLGTFRLESVAFP